jgi:hypothetical protein
MELLLDALMAHASAYEVVRVVSSPFGTKYVIEGPPQTLGGRNPDVRSVWIIEAGADISRLVTAYALKRQRVSNNNGQRIENP